MSGEVDLLESAAQALADLEGSRAFDPSLPDDPARQPERERYRTAARAAFDVLRPPASPRPELLEPCIHEEEYLDCEICQRDDDAPVDQGRSEQGPEVVTLCGSTRFQQTFIDEQRRLTLQGCIVISVGLFGHVEGLDMTSQTKVDLDDLHKRKIDLSDRIHVIDVGGYIGSSTRSEIEYARARGIAVTYLQTPAEHAEHVFALPPSGMEEHYITWVDHECATYQCRYPEGALCSSWCTTCQQDCPGPGLDQNGALHVWQPVPYCRMTTWLNAYASVAEQAWMDDGEELRRRDGRIEVEWDGESYLWGYADPEPAAASPAQKPARAWVAEHHYLDEAGREQALYGADPHCQHQVRAKGFGQGGGVVCLRCEGWYCL